MNLQQLADSKGVTLLSTHQTNNNEVIVLAEKESGYMRFVTWDFANSSFHYGHYFLTAEQGRADFIRRIGGTL